MANNAQEQARETAQQLKDRAQEVVGQNERDGEGMAAQARQLASQAQQKTSELGRQAAHMAETQVEQRKHRIAEGVGTLSEALRLGAEQLRNRGQTQEIHYVERLAGQVERISTYLDQKDTRALMMETERFARQNRTLFLGGAFALGMLGARFLKSTSTPENLRDVEDGWSTRELTNRVENPTRDAVGRPNAPGYEPPAERSATLGEHKAAGPRNS